MLGVWINTAAVILASLIGVGIGKLIPQRFTDTIMKGISLCVVYLGISGALAGQNMLVLILSLVFGALLGEWADLDGRLNRLASRLEQRYRKDDGGASLAEGFIAASMLVCTGAMAVIGSLQAGLQGDNSMLIAKAVIDFVAVLVFAATLGIGTIFSALGILLFEGAIVLASQALAPLLNDYTTAEMACAGSVLLLGVGLNLLGLTKIKVMNYLPAIFLPLLLCRLIPI